MKNIKGKKKIFHGAKIQQFREILENDLYRKKTLFGGKRCNYRGETKFA